MSKIESPPPSAQRLLQAIVQAIRVGRIREDNPRSFLSYSEALERMGIAPRGRAGQQLQREGLNELNGWTIKHSDLPKIAALIVNKRSHCPSEGFAKSHGFQVDDPNWQPWWMEEAKRAIYFDWKPFLTPTLRSGQEIGENVICENQAPFARSYREIITIEPGKRGGKPCIRGMRITVADVLGWLAAGMAHGEILSDFPELTEEDIRACLAFAAEKENRAVSIPR